MAASVIATGVGSYTTLSGPTVSATWTPQADDILIAWASCTNSAAAGSGVTDWPDVGPGLITPGDASCAMSAVRHVVTGAEATAGTTSWSLAGLFTGTETGEWMLAVVRGGDPATPIDAAASWFTATDTGTPHTLPGLAGADLATDSLVISGIIADNFSRTYTTPSGWTGHVTGAGTNTGRWLGSRTTLTTAGTDVADTSITPNTGDEGIAVTVAITAAAGAAITGTLTASTPAAVVAVPTSAWSGTSSGSAETTGTLAASTPTATVAVPASSWTGTSTPPQFTGTLTVDPDTDAVSIEVPLSSWAGTATAPTMAGTLTASSPAVTVAVPASAWTGTASIPAGSGVIAASLPTATVAVPAVAWAGTSSIPVRTGSVAASTPTSTVAVPTAAWSGLATVPTYSGTLAATTPAAVVAVPGAAWMGSSTGTAYLAATLPGVALGLLMSAWTGSYTPGSGHRDVTITTGHATRSTITPGAATRHRITPGRTL